MDALTSEAAFAVGAAGEWRLSPADGARVAAKSRATRLGFAVMVYTRIRDGEWLPSRHRQRSQRAPYARPRVRSRNSR